MKIFKIISIMLSISVSFVACLKFVSVDNLSKAVQKFACFSAFSVMPANINFINPLGFHKSDSTINSTSLPSSENQQGTEKKSEDSEKEDLVEAVAEGNTIGNIIKKTISPSTANTSYENIYINNKTELSLDLKAELQTKTEIKLKSSSDPQVLILHTHATESYLFHNKNYYTDKDQARNTNFEKNVISVGEKISQGIQAAGFGVVHDKTLHDYPSYNGSYARAEQTIKKYIKEYPSIKIVIDVHRDAISTGESDKVALVKTIQGKEAAQIMLVVGSQTGGITGFPNWKQNFRLALQVQKMFESDYPELARPMMFLSAKYNQNLSTGGLLIEIGTDANTLQQALYSGELVGKTLGKVLMELK